MTYLAIDLPIPSVFFIQTPIGNAVNPAFSLLDLFFLPSSFMSHFPDVGPILYSPEHFLSTVEALAPHQGQDLLVLIPAEHLTASTFGHEEIWGSNPYTPESDAVCVLQHSGLFDVRSEIGDDVLAIKLVLRIQPGETILPGSERHGIVSKSGASHIALSALQFELVNDPAQQALIDTLKTEMKVGPPRPHLTTSAPGSSTEGANGTSSMAVDDQPPSANGENDLSSISNLASAAALSAAPSSVPAPQKRVKRPRKSTSELDPRVTIDVLPDTILQFNLSNELSFQYNLNLICDRGIEPSQWTSHRLHNAVLMLETGQHRYELSWESSPSQKSADPSEGQKFDVYRFARVTSPTPKSRSWHSSHTVPLASEHASPIHSQLDWSQIVWGPATVTILGTVYPLKRIFWIARTDGEASSSTATTETVDHPSA